MTEAIKKELEELDKEEAKEEDVSEEEKEESGEEEQEGDKEEGKEPDNAGEEEGDNDEEEKLAKQEAYRERQKQKREEAKRRQEELQNKARSTTQNITEEEQDELAQIKKDMEQFKQIAYQQQYQQAVKQAERELEALEGEFKEAFTDYDDVVSQAINLSKARMVSQGMSESEAEDILRSEKVLLADRAAAQGKDPVEAVYNEAKGIVGWLDSYVKEQGYVRTDEKKKTNLQKMREVNKPNAMTGGRGAKAATTSFDDLGDEDLEEIHNTTIWDVK